MADLIDRKALLKKAEMQAKPLRPMVTAYEMGVSVREIKMLPPLMPFLWCAVRIVFGMHQIQIGVLMKQLESVSTVKS